MDGFKTTVLGVAVVVLILVLTVVGLMMAGNQANMLFPPTSLPCPNYWQLTSDGKCKLPYLGPGNGNEANLGSLKADSSNTPGYDSTNKTVDFNSNAWGASGITATCAKQAWAKKAGILWDGVSNYNGCT